MLDECPAWSLKLTPVSLDSEQRFTALSYVWGDPADKPSVVIDGYSVKVTKNLHSALSRLRRQGFTGHIWIDALCINQCDTLEKNSQVPLMARIYSQAENVLIWLGPEPDGGALRAIQQLGIHFREQVRNQPNDGGERIEAFVKTVRDYAITGTTRLQTGFDFEAIWRFFRQRAWWRRVWVIQEVVLAQHATVLCTENPQVSATWDDTITWTTFGNGSENAIQATDPRDRIYGLLGLVRLGDRQKILVDYSPNTTLDTVLSSVARALLEEHGPDVLSFCQGTDLSPDGRPSWVPDWTLHRVPGIGEVSLTSDTKQQYNASNGATWTEWASRSRIRGALCGDPVACLPGIIIGRAVEVGREFTALPFTPSFLNDCREWLGELKDIVARSLGHKGKDAAQQAMTLRNLWRIPIADVGLIRRPTAEDTVVFEEQYEILTGRHPPPADLDGEAADAWVIAQTWEYRRPWKIYQRRAFADDNGCPGLGPKTMEPGDCVVLLAGAHVPFIIRRDSNGGSRYRLVGPAYVQGSMDGEKSEKSLFIDIELI
ncbi:heterokaryon incompatibility protein-domain-containing protein [Immersiella caudata]|uniref:Heterokaryon incompatibility protein-domain-containing protein n=1 Tax=Immersiella caudata TaxID=314043 RepID=A0AA39WQF9_9PEZI|nr:heterokaryon incompatibility protein-domain-containing protein [Immersiella caudata]